MGQTPQLYDCADYLPAKRATPNEDIRITFGIGKASLSEQKPKDYLTENVSVSSLKETGTIAVIQ